MEKALSDIGEFGLIRIIDELISQEGIRASQLKVGVGDDAACFTPRQGFDTLVTCDTLVEGRHFLSDHFTPFEVGFRAMTVNISDIGAMGGSPMFAVVSLGLKQSISVDYVMEIYRGFLKVLNPFNASIVGGNITGSPDVFFIDITLIGEVEKGKLVRRSTARIGDTIFVTGYPGESAAGLNLLINSSGREVVKESRLINAYKAPSHRAFEAKALADSGYVNAMIDTSDGFLGDLGHICVESNVGAEIVRDQLPLSGALRLESEKSGLEPSDLVLGESDDYELIITCAPRHKEEIITVFDGFEDILLSEVGRIVAPSQGIRIMNPDGAFESLDPVGWDHFKV